MGRNNNRTHVTQVVKAAGGVEAGRPALGSCCGLGLEVQQVADPRPTSRALKHTEGHWAIPVQGCGRY
jgi:hypothetical protein